MSSLLLANLASQAVAEDQEVPQIGAYFLLGNNYQPAAWGNPIVPVYFDEENRHSVAWIDKKGQKRSLDLPQILFNKK